MAKRHEALYRRFKADESAQTITGPYRQLHPHDNNERQAVHEHGSALGTTPATSRSRSPSRTGAGDEPPAPARAPPGARAPARPRPARRPHPVRRGDPVRGRHRPRRHQPSATTPAPSARSTCRRRWARASPSSTTTTTAGSTSSSRTKRSGRVSPGPPTFSALYRNDRDGTFTDVTKAAGLAVADVRDRRHRRRLRQRRLEGPLRHRDRRQPPLPQPGQRDVRRRHREDGHEGAGHLRHERDVLRLRQGRAPRHRRRQLRDLDGREGPLLHARRQDEVVLHARVVQGGEPDPLPQPRRRHLRGRDPQGGALGPHLEGARGGPHRPRRRRLARLRPRQRHPAQQALPQQPRRHVHRRGHDGGDRVRRDRGGPRGDGRRRGGLLGRRAREPAHRATSRTR